MENKIITSKTHPEFWEAANHTPQWTHIKKVLQDYCDLSPEERHNWSGDKSDPDSWCIYCGAKTEN